MDAVKEHDAAIDAELEKLSPLEREIHARTQAEFEADWDRYSEAVLNGDGTI
jgi:hypothetical protein